jgi:hypothetical protein
MLMKHDFVSPRLLEALESELLSGEELKWVAQPLRWRRAWRKAGFLSVMTALLLLAWWLATLTLSPSLQIYVLMLAGFNAAMVAILVSQEVFDAWRTVYAITNRRVIVLKRGFRRSVISYGRKDMERIERQGDEVGDIIFGESHRTIPGVYSIPQQKRTQEGLFGIAHVREVEALLLETFQPSDNLHEKV